MLGTKMIVAEMEKSTSHHKDPLFPELVEHTPMKALQVGYDAATERVETPLFSQVGEVIFHIIQQE